MKCTIGHRLLQHKCRLVSRGVLPPEKSMLCFSTARLSCNPANPAIFWTGQSVCVFFQF